MLKLLLVLLFCAQAHAYSFIRMENGEPFRWKTKRITWYCESPRMRKFAKTGLIEWGELTGIQFVESASDPDIRIGEHEMSSYLAYSNITITPTRTTAAIKLNALLNWKKSFDPYTVMLHEIGHVLGLDHSDDPTSLMYRFIYPRKRKRIGYDDVAGILALYPRRSP